MTKIKTIFIGTPDFGAPTLNSLIQNKHFDITGVITQPDKKIGRKQIITPPPIKTIATDNNIPIFQPEKIKNFEIPNINLDLIVVIAYAQIIPKNILNLPKYGCINVHGSLLPKYRGASCIQAAILNGDKKTGITIMKMDEGLDTGPIITTKAISINQNDTTGTLFNKLSSLAGEVLPNVILDYAKKPIITKQDNEKASYVGLLKKQDGVIDWKKSATTIERFIRAMSPWPSAFSKITIDKKINNLSIKLLSTNNNVLKINNYQPGTIFIETNKLCIQCGKNAIIIKELQIEGKKTMTAEEFKNGYKHFIGKCFS